MTKIHMTVLQGKYLPFSPSPLRLNIFRLFLILSLTQLYRYTPEIFLFSTATFKYKYRTPLRRTLCVLKANHILKPAFYIYKKNPLQRSCRNREGTS
jgi:hypothetical protein